MGGRSSAPTPATHRPTVILADYYAQHGDSGLANYHRTMASSSQEAK